MCHVLEVCWMPGLFTFKKKNHEQIYEIVSLGTKWPPVPLAPLVHYTDGKQDALAPDLSFLRSRLHR